MADDDDRPFACSEPNCSMRFANEDHLSVHLAKHQMSLSLNPAAKTNLLFVDQTPTPTKFLRNCEEIGLFNELTKNPFEEAFKKAADINDNKPESHPVLSEVDSLHTPTALQSAAAHKISPLAKPPPKQLPLIVISPTPSQQGAPLPGPSTDTESTIASNPSSPSKVRALPPKKAMLAKQVREEEQAKTDAAEPAAAAVNPDTKPSQYVLQVLVQMPGGDLVPMQIPASVATPTVTSAPSTPAQGLASVSTKQKLKAAIQQNAVKSEAKEEPKPKTPLIGNAVPICVPLSNQSSVDTDSENSVGFSCEDSPLAAKRRRTTSADSDDPEDRRKKFLERNRAAAARCRQKKKAWIGNLESKAEDLQTTNHRLLNEVAMLKSEVAQLKGLLLAHKDCPVTLQQRQLSLAQSLETQSASISSTSQPALSADSSAPTPEAIATSALATMATKTLAPGQTYTIINVPISRS